MYIAADSKGYSSRCYNEVCHLIQRYTEKSAPPPTHHVSTKICINLNSMYMWYRMMEGLTSSHLGTDHHSLISLPLRTDLQPLDIRTSPPNIRTALLYIKTDPPDIRTARPNSRTAPPHIRTAPLHIRTLLMRIEILQSLRYLLTVYSGTSHNGSSERRTPTLQRTFAMLRIENTIAVIH